MTKLMMIVNRKAKQKYQVLDEFEAGLVLVGTEVKSLRLGRGSITEAFVRIKDGEMWVHNLLIPAYQGADENYDPGRARKLLVHKREILSLEKKMEGKNLTLVPLRCYFRNNRVKLGVGLARGKRQFERKEELKRRDLQRELRRDFKEDQLN